MNETKFNKLNGNILSATNEPLEVRWKLEVTIQLGIESFKHIL